jgi:predicted nucleotidyltransferase
MNLQSTLEKIITYAAHIAGAEKIILFGSMATGKQNVYSDVDLLIITAGAIGKKEVTETIKNYANQCSLKTDVLIYSLSEVGRELNISNSFIGAIYKHGKIVYKKSD